MKHYLGICLVLLTISLLGLAALHSCTSAADHTVEAVKNAFAQVLQIQPQVTINQRVILTQTFPIAQLAVVTKDEVVSTGYTQHMEVFSYQLPMTEKTLGVEATFHVKAGFDLSKPFRVQIDPVTHHVKATLPHAEILSVEQLGDLNFHSEDSALNRITDDERTKLLDDLNALAHQQAEASSLKQDAERQVRERLEQIIGHNGATMDTDWEAPPAPLEKPST